MWKRLRGKASRLFSSSSAPKIVANARQENILHQILIRLTCVFSCVVYLHGKKRYGVPFNVCIFKMRRSFFTPACNFGLLENCNTTTTQPPPTTKTTIAFEPFRKYNVGTYMLNCECNCGFCCCCYAFMCDVQCAYCIYSAVLPILWFHIRLLTRRRQQFQWDVDSQVKCRCVAFSARFLSFFLIFVCNFLCIFLVFIPRIQRHCRYRQRHPVISSLSHYFCAFFYFFFPGLCVHAPKKRQRWRQRRQTLLYNIRLIIIFVSAFLKEKR